MEFLNGQILELDIIDQNYDGLGVGKIDNYAIFVNGAIVGERVKVKLDKVGKSYATSHVLQVIKASKSRVEPKCPYFPKCGGCSLLHMTYSSTLDVKLKAFNDTLRRIGNIDFQAKEILGMESPVAFRNKIQMPVSKINKNGKDKLVVGYYEKETHNVIPIDKCFSQSDQVTDIIKYVKNICDDFKVTSYNEQTKKGALRHIFVRENYKNEIMLVLITNEYKIPNEKEIVNKVVTKFPNVISVIKNINKMGNNVILGNDSVCLYGKDEIEDEILGIKYHISHMSFFQVNRCQTNKLYGKVLEFLGDNTEKLNVIDGYCGVGSISLALAKKVNHVYGIEVVKEAIDDAINNAKLNDINNCDFYVDKVEDKIKDLIDKDIDCVVIDPPRKGVEEVVLKSIMETKIKKVIYVSCNPATLARDLGILKEQYNIKNICLVDMFCYSSGVESVSLLELKE